MGHRSCLQGAGWGRGRGRWMVNCSRERAGGSAKLAGAAGTCGRRLAGHQHQVHHTARNDEQLSQGPAVAAQRAQHGAVLLALVRHRQPGGWATAAEQLGQHHVGSRHLPASAEGGVVRAGDLFSSAAQTYCRSKWKVGP